MDGSLIFTSVHYADAHYNLGRLLQGLQRFEAAEAAYRHVLRARPDCVEACYNMGVLWQEQHRFQEAEAAYRQTIRIQPRYADAHYNLGILLETTGQLDEAEACYRQALASKPDYFAAHSGLLFVQNYRYDSHRAASFAEAMEYGERVAAQARMFRHKPNRAALPRRLRIGLVSGDLRHHPVGFFLEGVLASLRTADVALFAYDTSALVDFFTDRLKGFLHHWRTVTTLTDAELARLIQADAIDILLDVSGHTAHNRLPVFAWKPAPIQVAWLGYCATTGVAAMDYILGDAINLPDREKGHFLEKTWRLPDCYFCFTPPDFAIAVAALPADTQPFVTFGCFNNATKITPAVLDCWANILLAVPESRLFLKNHLLRDPLQQQKIAQQFQQARIAPERLILEGPQTREAYLAAYNRVDIALDPFPFPGGTTSIEGLWMGVPVLTRKGNRFLAHQGETILVHAGLSEWIAQDTADYVAKAIAFANDRPRLSALRAGLRQQVLQSPLFDAPRFANNLLEAWREMWRIWCQSG
ncbi:MAG: tetratricopeptide repeat protein [Magnetococcales bacterium]|nr:tetratricopeptide repeat protein [Magnetococcales bacterium]